MTVQSNGECSQCSPGHDRGDGRCARHGKTIAALAALTDGKRGTQTVSPVLTYAQQELTVQLERGPYPGEDFYRLKVTGNGESKHVNISSAQLAAIIAVLATE
jgi:hypothetical protein